jgi:NCS1 family nucleobase:cation symporter-1
MYAPIVGIVFVDFFVLRRQRLSLWAIFEGAPGGAYHYSHGFHWPALASLLLGQGLYLFLFNPITGETHALFRLMPASVAACVVPALTYWLATLVMRKAATADRNAPRHLVEPNI